MKILVSETRYVLVPVDGPAGEDLTLLPVSMAIVPETAGEPATSDYQAATWIGGEAALLVTAGSRPAGQYMVYVRVVATPEDVRLASGRLRIGDART